MSSSAKLDGHRLVIRYCKLFLVRKTNVAICLSSFAWQNSRVSSIFTSMGLMNYGKSKNRATLDKTGATVTRIDRRSVLFMEPCCPLSNWVLTARFPLCQRIFKKVLLPEITVFQARLLSVSIPNGRKIRVILFPPVCWEMSPALGRSDATGAA